MFGRMRSNGAFQGIASSMKGHPGRWAFGGGGIGLLGLGVAMHEPMPGPVGSKAFNNAMRQRLRADGYIK